MSIFDCCYSSHPSTIDHAPGLYSLIETNNNEYSSTVFLMPRTSRTIECCCSSCWQSCFLVGAARTATGILFPHKIQIFKTFPKRVFTLYTKGVKHLRENNKKIQYLFYVHYCTWYRTARYNTKVKNTVHNRMYWYPGYTSTIHISEILIVWKQHYNVKQNHLHHLQYSACRAHRDVV